MKKLLIPIFFLILSLTSCNNNIKLTSISLFDNDIFLGQLKGQRLTELSKEDKDKLNNFERKEDSYFKGWYTQKPDLESAKRVSINNYPSKDISLYANFAYDVTITLEQVEYYASFKVNYPEGIYLYEGISNENIGFDFPIPEVEKHYFEGWKIKGTDEIFESLKYPTKSIVLVPSFIADPKLSFVSNVEGISFPSISISPTSNIKEALDNNNFDDSSLFTVPEKKFLGWSESEDPEIFNPFNFNRLMGRNNITLYANLVSKVKIHFDTSSMNNIKIDDIVAYPYDKIEVPTFQEGFDLEKEYFIGWYQKNENGEFEDENFFYQNKVMPYSKKDITLYPQYRNKTKIDLYEKDNLLTSYYYKEGQSINLNSLTYNLSTIKEYYSQKEENEHLKFLGIYYLDSNNKKVYISNINSYVIPSSDTKLYFDFANKNLATFNFYDVNDTLISNIDPYLVYAYKEIEDKKEELNSYVNKNLDNDYYEILNYKRIITNSENNSTTEEDVIFPLSIDSETNLTFKTILATKVNVTFNIITVISEDGSDKNTISSINLQGRQTARINKVSLQKDETNDSYLFYEQKLNIKPSEYYLYKVESNQKETNLINSFPKENTTYDVIFKSK